MYGTEFMAKSLAFIWCLLGTKPVYGVDVESHGRVLNELSRLIDDGKIKCTLQKELPLTVKGLREAHEILEGGKSVGKVACGIDVQSQDQPFT